MGEKYNNGDEMAVLTLEEIETRVQRNSKKYNDTIQRLTTEIQSKNSNKGRVRPKDVVEEKILSRFSKK